VSLASSSQWFVALAAVAAGTLDILFAMVYWFVKAGTPPTRILQSVAAGLLGRGSFAGGLQTAAMGLALHFAIVAVMALVYYAIASKWRALNTRPLLFGALYGVVLYAAMQFVVVPLSAASPPPKDGMWVALGIVAHVVLVGIPISFGARHALRARVA
jgi:uncharacterized membrane protein YagU involved in acid resistance